MIQGFMILGLLTLIYRLFAQFLIYWILKTNCFYFFQKLCYEKKKDECYFYSSIMMMIAYFCLLGSFHYQIYQSFSQKLFHSLIYLISYPLKIHDFFRSIFLALISYDLKMHFLSIIFDDFKLNFYSLIYLPLQSTFSQSAEISY